MMWGVIIVMHTLIFVIVEVTMYPFLGKLLGKKFNGDSPVDLNGIPRSAKKRFSDVVTKNLSLLYMHEFFYSYPDCLSMITGK